MTTETIMAPGVPASDVDVASMDLPGTLPGEPAGLERMMAAILERYREAGELPPERQLRDELAVTRHRLRTALARLRAEGRLPPARTGRRPVGATQVEGSEFLARLANPLELMELRLIIEPTLARLTALRASSLEIARVVKLATTPPGSPAAATDIAFHRAVAQASRNTLAGEIYALLRRIGTDQRIRVAGSDTSCPRRIRERDGEHQRVASAIAARDGAAAEQAMREHLLAVQRRILERTAAGGAVA
jgi:DNA-binding FadR family transcriptional regulator